MATTKKKSTTAKKKTSKNSSNKSKKSLTAKTNSKSTSKQAKANKKSVSLKFNKESFKSVNAWHWILSLVYAAQAVAIVAISNSVKTDLTLNHLAEDTLASSEGNQVLAQASRLLASVDVPYLLAALLAVGAIAHFLSATLLRKRYESDIKENTNIMRWVEIGLSSSFALIIIGMLSGISDLGTLELLADLVIVSALLGLVMEKYFKDAGKVSWLTYWVSVFAGVVPWVIIAVTIWASIKYGSANIPNYLYWATGLVFLGNVKRALSTMMHYKNKKIVLDLADYQVYNYVHMATSLVISSVLVWVIYFGILK